MYRQSLKKWLNLSEQCIDNITIFCVILILSSWIIKIVMKKKRNKNNKSEIFESRSLEFSKELDSPVDFGYKCEWLAIKTEDTHSVVDYLGLEVLDYANWESGIYNAYDYKNKIVFVTPPVDGWTFVVSRNMSSFIGHVSTPEYAEKYIKNCERLASKIPNFYHFATCRIVGFSSWVFAKNGKVTRAFGFSEGNITCNFGAETKTELGLGLTNFIDFSSDEAKNDDNYGEQENLKWPDEVDVVNLSITMTTNHMNFGNYPNSKTLGVMLKAN